MQNRTMLQSSRFSRPRTNRGLTAREVRVIGSESRPVGAGGALDARRLPVNFVVFAFRQPVRSRATGSGASGIDGGS